MRIPKMKKLILTICILCFVRLCYADFDFGATTYENVDDSLVVNSLGDEGTVSQYGLLGTNDWIPENGVKNYLKLEGYTQAYDYNPSANHTWGVYDQPLPNGGNGLTELSFAGLLGDPRTEQKVYVLTEEYNRLSALKQAEAIDYLNDHIYVPTPPVPDINAQNIKNQQNQLNDLNNKVDKLEQMDSVVVGKIRWKDTKKWEFESYLKYSNNRQNVSEIGIIEVTYKFGESYTDKKLRELEAKIDKMNNIEQVSDSEIYTNGTSSIGIRTKF